MIVFSDGKVNLRPILNGVKYKDNDLVVIMSLSCAISFHSLSFLITIRHSTKNTDAVVSKCNFYFMRLLIGVLVKF